MKASDCRRCGASWFDKLTMKRFLHFQSGSQKFSGFHGTKRVM